MSTPNNTIKESIKEQVSALPLSPGVYQFLNKKGDVIYVGKAKSLRKRVSSYFTAGKDHSAKVQVLVSRIDQIKHIVVDSEGDALLLENSLIKQLQPKYNILLKDDKTYPWIAIINEPFPRIVSTRTLARDGSQYFGPYSSISTQNAVMEFIKDVVPLRTCKLNLSPQAIERGKYRVCLQYHIGNCHAPCIGAQSPEEYSQSLNIATLVLKGNLRLVRRHFEEQMQRAAQELKFEVAQQYKRRLAALENYTHKSVIVSSKIVDVDLFSLVTDDPDTAYCNYLRVRHGSIVGHYTVQMDVKVDTPPEEILSQAIIQIIERTSQTLTKEVITSHLPSAAILFDGVVFTIPKRGEKLDLLNFSLRSARLFRAEQLKNMAIVNPERSTDRLMKAMQSELNLDVEPRHIECFDNSNLQGTNPVASCVVFRDGKPSRKEYRHFNIKSVVGADDFASMREIIFRRYSRMILEDTPLPDLIIVDGGKGQLSSAYAMLRELQIEEKVAIIGLAKRIEEVFYPNNPTPFILKRTGEPLKVLCYLRDEAHRFGITFHRQKRSNNFLSSMLDEIEGIGAKSRDALLQHFKSIKQIKDAPISEIEKIIGVSRAKKIAQYIEKKRSESLG